MKFLLDMPVTPEAVGFLASRGHDAVHAFTVGLATATDSEILAVAQREGRVVITADGIRVISFRKANAAR